MSKILLHYYSLSLNVFLFSDQLLSVVTSTQPTSTGASLGLAWTDLVPQGPPKLVERSFKRLMVYYEMIISIVIINGEGIRAAFRVFVHVSITVTGTYK